MPKEVQKCKAKRISLIFWLHDIMNEYRHKIDIKQSRNTQEKAYTNFHTMILKLYTHTCFRVIIIVKNFGRHRLSFTNVNLFAHIIKIKVQILS